ncbi:MAG: acyl-CoA dehydrogenase family protein [Nocardioides sp.]|jgi:alkylation response protein AidB-like acyl-CoA dehydrogenase
MDVTRTEEQLELASMVRSLLDKRADSGAVRAAMESEAGYDADLWSMLCEQVGLAALPIPESYDGAGFTFAESLVVAEEVGRSLAPSPLLGTLLATAALLASGNASACADLLPRIAAGEVATVAFDDSDVLFGDSAQIVLGFVDGALVQIDSADWTSTPAMDPTLRLASYDTATAATTILATDGSNALAAGRRTALVTASSLAVGCMQRGLDMTVAYSKERVQFGRQIGSFQALKHRMADLLVRLEMARSITWAAANALGCDDPEADRLAHVAAAYALEAAQAVAGEVVQLHGGIAITWEHDAHLIFKRAHALATLFGQPHELRAALA